MMLCCLLKEWDAGKVGLDIQASGKVVSTAASHWIVIIMAGFAENPIISFLGIFLLDWLDSP